jgi:hypothetical protein
LEAAAKAGHLSETHTVELKRELAAGDAANKELAADLASLSVDGGLLFIGVDEDTGPGLAPVLLDGLAERVEQVARARIDEPVHLTFAAIMSKKQPGRGYLLVRVPASPRAPHMVGHRYWGRGDKTKFHLADSQVELLMARRAKWAADTEQDLREWMARDPIAAVDRKNGHLFIVASPVPRRERLLLPVFSGAWPDALNRLVSATTHRGSAFVPDMPDGLNSFSTTPDGWAWYSYAIFGQRENKEAESEDRMLMVEICEDGRLRLLCGRAVPELERGHTLLDDLCLGLTARMVSLAGLVSTEAGFLGSWDLGVGITGLRGSFSYTRYSWGPGGRNSYPEDEYSGTTRASITEIETSTGPVVERLLGRLMRASACNDLPDVKRHFA